MKTNFFFKKMLDVEEKEVREYVEKKLNRVVRLTSKMPEDGVSLRVVCEKFEKHNAYEVELILELPSEKITAKEASHATTKAIDLAFDRLITQLRKSKEE